jgi:predicted nucleic acid-binding protein
MALRHLLGDTNAPARELQGRYFFDTSAWIYMFGPLLDIADRRTKLYSIFYRDILEAGAQIVIDYLVVAEFVNRYIRDIHKFHVTNSNAPSRFKDFRKTQE